MKFDYSGRLVVLFWCFRRRSVDPAMDRAMRSFEDATRHQCVMTLAIVSTTRRILLTAVEATDAMVRISLMYMLTN